MTKSAEFFRELAERYRQLARGLHNNELIAALLRLAADCDERADALARTRGAGRAAYPGPIGIGSTGASG
jgi:hypothetical protein